ncbi:hypothetical protein TorRG33x02_288840 [Trema orientale]|uniref:Uncharacterized protein n=1 Tax=Trema orientale TaxID=63057 RepID=A0A2P5CDU2_TREOI|nr:hypothetical protein TorRG33x02_288840 [Trema orientale]
MEPMSPTPSPPHPNIPDQQEYEMSTVDPNLRVLPARKRACEGSGHNSPGSNSRPTPLRITLPLCTSELPPAPATRTPPSSSLPDKRPMETPHPNEPSA